MRNTFTLLEPERPGLGAQLMSLVANFYFSEFFQRNYKKKCLPLDLNRVVNSDGRSTFTLL